MSTNPLAAIRKRSRSSSSSALTPADDNTARSDKKPRPNAPPYSILTTPTARPAWPWPRPCPAAPGSPASPLDARMSDDEMPDADADADDAPGPQTQSPCSAARTRLLAGSACARAPAAMAPARQHLRDRHPQEYSSSGHVDGEQAALDAAAADAAADADATRTSFSQLSMHDASADADPFGAAGRHAESATDGSEMNAVEQRALAPKRRQRSGALSSPSPVGIGGVGGAAFFRRGLSVGFRPECENCRLQVPGHMNHFVN